MEFKVGEIAILCNCIHSWNEGLEVTITTKLVLVDFCIKKQQMAHGIDLHGFSYAPLSGLKKLPPKDDTCSWEECEWAPTRSPVEEKANA